MAEIVFKHFHVFKHPDLAHSPEWSMTRSAVCLVLDFHNHGNAGRQMRFYSCLMAKSLLDPVAQRI